MTISEVQALLTKVQQVAGDADVVLRAAEGAAETVIQTVGIELGAGGNPASSEVTITHGPPAPAPAPAPAQPPDTPAL